MLFLCLLGFVALVSGTVRDIVSTAGDTRCFSSNYKYAASDFYSSPNGITWDFHIATFGFDWPQGNILNVALGFFTYVDRIQFSGSDNLAYFRVVFTLNDGTKVTTDPILPDDKDKDVKQVRNVKRVDFFLAPNDFRRNVTVNDVDFKLCAKDPIFGWVGVCSLFDLFKDVISAVSLGEIRPGSQKGTFTISIGPQYPYVELDLACLGTGSVDFDSVSFDRTSNFDTVVINVWDGARVVPVFRQDGVSTNTFNYAQGIKFGSGVHGNRIRSTIIPNGLPDQGITGSIWFSRYAVNANVV